MSFNGEEYDNVKYKPRGTVKLEKSSTPHGAQKIMRFISHMAGENHAFLSSTAQQTVIKTTAVPTLDAFHDLFIRIERIQKYIDFVSICYGDGFPNCESFIEDAAGTKLFLGSHVRIGYPATHLWTEQKRLIWATSVRAEIDSAGNFGTKLWVFSHVLGGPPDLRDDYPVFSSSEICRPWVKKPRITSSLNALSHERGDFVWDCGNEDEILEKSFDAGLPLYLSAMKTSIERVRELVHRRWAVGPSSKTTISAWNSYHLHRDPNQGRSPDDPEYQVTSDKWKRKTPL